jgi:hypothetical protein
LDRIRLALEDANAHVARAATSGGRFRFADWTVQIRIAAVQRADDLLRMVEHRRVTEPEPEPADWEIAVIEGAHAGLEPLRPPSGHDQRLVDITGDYYYYWAPERSGNLTLVDRGRRRAVLWYPSPGEISFWEFSRPFVYPIHALMLPTAWAPVHAAAVARNGAAILIAGYSKAGKSTTALVCAEAGWDYISDDFVLVGGTPSRACGIYRSARMREDMFDHLPRSMKAVTAISTEDGEVRAEVDVAQMGRIGSRDSRIRAVVLPRRTGAARATLAPCRPSQVLQTLAGSTSIMLGGGQAEVFTKLSGLIKNVPCYTFDPGPSITDIPAALASLTDQDSFEPCA